MLRYAVVMAVGLWLAPAAVSAAPVDTVPAETVPAETVPVDTVLGDTVPLPEGCSAVDDVVICVAEPPMPETAVPETPMPEVVAKIGRAHV